MTFPRGSRSAVAAVAVNPPWARLTLQGEIDLETAPDWRGAVEQTASPLVHSYLLDLREVSFMDSAGLSVLARMVRHADSVGGRVLVLEPRPPVLKVIRITGLAELVELVDESLVSQTLGPDGSVTGPADECEIAGS